MSRVTTIDLRRALVAPLPAGGLAAFRIGLGLLVAFSAARFVAYGWVEEFFVQPRFFFKFWGFSWVPHPGEAGVRWLFGALIGLGLLLAAGVCSRLSAALLAILFTWVQLIDQANYLNHYYLVSLLLALTALMPLGRAGSLVTWLSPRRRQRAFPAWMTYLLRFQVGTVYFFAGKAKLGEDWLLHGAPLSSWLASRVDLPVLGGLFLLPYAPQVMSWAGFLFDLSVPLWLSLRRTRLAAYLVLICFHIVTGALFPIGLFPHIMTFAALIFFPPDWPSRLLTTLKRAAARLRGRPAEELTVCSAPRLEPTRPLHPVALGALAVYVALQLLLPLRMHLYGGNVLWHEQGMRFAWKVMVRKKHAAVTYHLEDRATGRRWYARPRDLLDARQEREFGTQPDLVLQLAHHLRDRERREGRDVRVRAEAWVSLNGRPPALLIDPEVDLSEVKDGLMPYAWVLPAPPGPPPRLHPVR